MNGDTDQLYQPSTMPAPPDQVEQPPQPAQPPQPVQPQKKSFDQVLQEHQQAVAANPNLSGMSVHDFSHHMNNITGTNQYDEGLNDSFLRRQLTGLDLGLHHFGGPGAFGPFVRPAFEHGVPTPSEWFGGPHEGVDLPHLANLGITKFSEATGSSPYWAEAYGKGAESLVGSLPTIAAGMVSGPAALPVMGAMAGAQTYGETGRWAPAALAAAGTASIGKFMDWGGRAALRLMGAKAAGALAPEYENLISKSAPGIADRLSELTASGPGQVAGEFTGRQLGLTANMLATQAAQTAVEPDRTWDEKLKDLGDMFRPSSLVSQVIGQLPFTLMDLGGAFRAGEPIERVKENVEGQFSDAFTKKWMEDRLVPPTPQEVQEGVERAKEAKPVEAKVPITPEQEQMDLFGIKPEAKRDSVGEVLASMEQAPLIIDPRGMETPVITRDEAWPMSGPTGAMETTRSLANDMLVAQGLAVHTGEGFNEGHDQSLYSAIRATEEIGKGRLDKEGVAQIAAGRLVDIWRRDMADLKVGGYRPGAEYPPYPIAKGGSPESTQEKFEDDQAVMAEITRRISPTIPSDAAIEESKRTGGTIPVGTGRLNPDYDPDLAQKIALISGDRDQWLEAGIPENLHSSIMQTIGEGEAAVEPEKATGRVSKAAPLITTLPNNIINMTSNLGPKLYQKMQILQQMIQDEIATNGFFTVNSHNRDVKSQTTPDERAIPSDYNPRLAQLYSELIKMQAIHKYARGGETPLADVTAEAYKAATKYTKNFDINDPASVGDFVRYIKGVINTQEANWSRVRAASEFVTDPQGNTLKPESREAALGLAREFQRLEDANPGEFHTVYRVPPEAEKDGTFRVVKHQYINIFSMPATRELGTFETPTEVGAGTVGARLAATEPGETTEKAEKPTPLEERINMEGANLKDLQGDWFDKRFMKLGELSDPVEREARRGALAANAVDFINSMTNAEFAKVTTDYTGQRRLRDVNSLRQQFIRYFQFMRVGGHVEIVPNKTGTGLIGVGNLEAFNNFMHGIGMGVANYPEGHRHAGEPRLSEWNREINGANFFEKFLNFSRYMGRYMLDPRTGVVDGERRPDGDYGFLSPRIGEGFMNKVNVPWADGVGRGAPFGAASEKFPDLLYSKKGQAHEFTVVHNPVADMQIRSTENDLFTRAYKVVDLYERFGNVDPTDLAVAKQLLKIPFVRQQHVGFSFAQNPDVRGYFHTSGVLDSSGLLVDPYRPVPGGRVELMTPRESFKHLLEELGHSAVDFAFNTDLKWTGKDQYLRDQLTSFREEATAIHKFLVEHRKSELSVFGNQVVNDNLIHTLKDPREMLAQVMSNSDFRTWLASVPDSMDHPLPVEGGYGTNMFQRLWNLLKRVFGQFLGPDSSGYMLNRLSQVTTRGIQLQERMRLTNTPDIYNFLQQEHKLDVERLEELRGQPVPRPGEVTQVYPQPIGVAERPEAKQNLAVQLLAARIQLDGIIKRVAAIPEENTAAREVGQQEQVRAAGVVRELEQQLAAAPSPRAAYEKPEVAPEPSLAELAKGDPLRQQLVDEIGRAEWWVDYTKGVTMGIGISHEHAQENLDLAKRKLEIYDSYGGEPIPQNIGWQIKDIESALADAKVMHGRALTQELPNLVYKYQALIMNLEGIRDRLAQTQTERLAGEVVKRPFKGQVLESREISPQRVWDVIGTMGPHTSESLDGDTFLRPYSMKYVRDTLGPVFGDKLRLDVVGNQMGYKINAKDVNALTFDDIARMPQAIVKPWAPSLWETTKSLYVQDGADNETAEAMANFHLLYGATLKNTDRVTWGKTETKAFAASAWGPWSMAGLTPSLTNKTYYSPQQLPLHESAHLAGITRPDFLKYNTPEVNASVTRLNNMFEGLSPSGRENLLNYVSHISNLDYATTPWVPPQQLATSHEFAAYILQHVGDVIMNVPEYSVYLKDMMRHAPWEVSNLLSLNTWRRLQGIERFTESIVQSERTRGFDSGPLLTALNDAVGIYKGMARSALEIAEDISDFQRTRLIYPDQYRGLLQAMDANLQNLGKNLGDRAPRIPGEALESRIPPAIEKLVRDFFPLPTSDGRLPRKLGIWDKTLTQFSQFAAKYPVARSFYDMLATSRAISQNTRIKMMTALAGAYSGGRVTDDVRTGHVAEFMKSPQLRNAFSKIALDLNLYGDTKYDQALQAANGDHMAINPQEVTGWLTPQFINGLMDKYGVPANKRDAMRTVMDGTRNQVSLTRDNLVASHTHALQTLTAKVVSLNSNLNPEQSRAAAQLLQYALESRLNNPEVSMQKMLQFQAIVKNPQVVARAFDFMESGLANIERLDRFLELRAPYFMSERRPGGFGLIYRDATGKVQSQYYGTGVERDKAIVSKNLRDGDFRSVNPQDRDYGISQSVFGILDEVHNRVVEKLTPLFGEDQAKELGQVLDYSNELRNALNARDVLRATTNRDLAPGREELDMFSAHQHYLNATTAAIRNRFIKLEAELLFTDPGFANEPYIKDFVKGHIQAVLQPDSQLGRTIQQLSFLHYLWGNISSMIMQMSHQVMGLAPMLTARGASVAGSYGLLKDANLAVTEAKGWFGGGKGYRDKEIGQMVERAIREGAITSWIARELDHAQDLSMVNRMRVTQGMPEWKAFDLLKNPLYQGYSMIRRIYDLVPIYNSEVAFVASLMHLKSKAGGGLTGEQLYNEARFLKDNTMFPGGKENRPGAFQYFPRSAAQALWSLQTYANGLTTMMGEFIRRSVNPKGANLTPAQGAQVRKAAAQMLFAQVSIAGVMGMPFAASLLFALQKLLPDHDVEGDVRKTLANLAGDDGALGQSLSGAMMNGVPSTFSYGPDVGSRFALAGVFHVSPYSGVGWEQLTGPVGGIISQAVQGTQAGLRGDPMQTVESLMPAGFQRIWNTVSQGQQYRTASGRVVANDLQPAEIAARLIGFRPARVARIEDLENLQKVHDAAEKSEQTHWDSKQAKLLQEGRDQEVQQNIAQRVAEKKGVYSAKHYASGIAAEYENQTMPTDLRRFGGRASVLAQKSLRGVLGTQTEGPSNMDRMMLQQQIAQRLGGLGMPAAGRFRHAGALDTLMGLYPHLTNSQANLLLTHAASSRPSPELYEELLSGGE